MPAFAPATLCTGYLVAWASNLHDFRNRSFVERILWSVPLSLAVSTIVAILIGKAVSLTAVIVFFMACALCAAATLVYERRELRAAGKKWSIGWRPFGTRAFIIAAVWSVVAILSLVDIQKNEGLYASLTIFDHSMRVSWVESVMRTGIPPMNPLYMDQNPAPMRYYYFWYVLCAAIAKLSHLSARAVMMASCVWAGFSVVALAGIYTKHFLEAGERTRRQVLRICGLMTVTGLGFLVNLWGIVHHTRQLPGELEIWRAGQITSWFNSMLWVPHHVASMVCCMTGFLLIWLDRRVEARQALVTVLLSGAAFASAFGLSIYVAFAFFLVMLAWILWQALTERSYKSSMLLVSSGGVAAALLIPFLLELMHGSSAKQGGPSIFSFAIRETISPEGLLGTSFSQHITQTHPFAAHNFADLILLAPGYAVELGFYFVVLLIYLIPAWRGRTRLTPGQRSLVCISVAALVFVSFIRSSVIESNDFGWRGALLMQFCLLLLAADVMAGWTTGQRKEPPSSKEKGAIDGTPGWVRAVASYAIIFGALTTIYQAALVRFAVPLHELQLRVKHDPAAGRLPHKMYISAIGYAKLDAAIPGDAVVQYNPWISDTFWLDADWLGVDHQSVIDNDIGGGCGAEFGGDARGCPSMARRLDTLYGGATADQARATCKLYGIGYLVANVYDPAWKDRESWIWSLRPAVADSEYRAVDCR